MKKTINGFTIVELLIVVIVISIIAAITVVAFNGMQARAKDSERHTEIRVIRQALENFYTVNGYYPGVNQITGTAGQTTLSLPASTVNAPDNYGGIRVGWASQHWSTAYKYVGGQPNGQVCSESPCTGYVLGYWAPGEDKEYQYTELQGK